jgi:hypothetical protein
MARRGDVRIALPEGRFVGTSEPLSRFFPLLEHEFVEVDDARVGDVDRLIRSAPQTNQNFVARKSGRHKSPLRSPPSRDLASATAHRER